jgi:hypothetical protein
VIKDGLLSWEQGGVAFEKPVQIENVSLRGCLLRSYSGPGNQPGLKLLLRAPGIDVEDQDAIEAVLISDTKFFLGRHRIRVRFLRSLPFAAFKSLVNGKEKTVNRSDDIPDYEQDGYWR